MVSAGPAQGAPKGAPKGAGAVPAEERRRSLERGPSFSERLEQLEGGGHGAGGGERPRGVLRHGRRGAGGPEAGRDAGGARGAARRGLRHRPQARRLGRLHRVLPGGCPSPPRRLPPGRSCPPHPPPSRLPLKRALVRLAPPGRMDAAPRPPAPLPLFGPFHPGVGEAGPSRVPHARIWHLVMLPELLRQRLT